MFKKQLLLSSLFVLAQSAYAKEQPSYQFYGQMNLGVLHAEKNDARRIWQLENIASRLGIKGEYALEQDITLLFQYETGINPTEKSTPIFSQRNTFVGVRSRYGQVIYGTFDTPLKLAQQKIDLFNDTSFDMSKVMAGEVRHSQSIQYSTPQLAGFQAVFNWLPSQDKKNEDGFSASLNYEIKRAAFSLAMDSKVAGDGGVIVSKSAPLDNYRASVSVKPLTSLTLGVLAQLSQGVKQDKSEEYNWLMSAQWQIKKFALKAQVAQGQARKDELGNKADQSLSAATIGLDYNFAKNAQLYVYTGAAREKKQITKTYYRTGVGLKYKF